MKLKFKRQPYQEDAALSVINCFNGQPKRIRKELIGKRKNETTITNWEQEKEEDIIYFGNNKIEIAPEQIRKNIRAVQNHNNLDYTDNQGIENYSIEMETGTGKTYTYIKTMYELNKNTVGANSL